jgi:hypothetical protein
MIYIGCPTPQNSVFWRHPLAEVFWKQIWRVCVKRSTAPSGHGSVQVQTGAKITALRSRDQREWSMRMIFHTDSDARFSSFR